VFKVISTDINLANVMFVWDFNFMFGCQKAFYVEQRFDSAAKLQPLRAHNKIVKPSPPRIQMGPAIYGPDFAYATFVPPALR
jgi:hypothetical protein